MKKLQAVAGLLSAFAIILCVIVLTTGCTAMNAVKSKAKDLTDDVCGMSMEEREALRASVDAITYPNKIRIECNGQGE